jgi:hypothetical protein
MKTTRKTIKRANLFDLAEAGLISVMNTISLFNNGTRIVIPAEWRRRE